MKRFREEFKNPGPEYRAAPFWAWNGALREEELRRQVRDMKRRGLGGFFIHPRVGMETAFMSREYLDLIVSIRVVAGLEEAIDHINRFGSHHTDAIVTGGLPAAEHFVERVDSAVVLVNASTMFCDAASLGMGAEIGISTDRLHARGPVGLEELTTYKFVIRGSGQIMGPPRAALRKP